MITVSDHPEHRRYEVSVDGAPAGWVAYRWNGPVLVFTHAEVDPAFGGRGVGTALARETLDDVRRRGLQMTPQCPFIAAFVAKHAEYVDLVDAEHPADFG
jgi:predicted GNAT family acetyltransferase